MIISIICILIGSIFGYIFIRKSKYLLRKEEIIKEKELDANSNVFKFTFNVFQPNTYSISFVGCKGFSINDTVFKLEKDDDRIELNNIARYVSSYKGKYCVEIYSFNASAVGKYKLSIKNIQSIKCYSSNLKSIRLIVGSSTVKGKYLLIKKFVDPVKKIMIIVSAIISLLFISLSIIAFNF